MSFGKSGKCGFGGPCRLQHMPRQNRRGKAVQAGADASGRNMDGARRRPRQWIATSALTIVAPASRPRFVRSRFKAAPVGSIRAEVTCEEMACGVQALSIGKHCADGGFGLAWKPFESCPDFLDPLGNPCPITVENLAPLMLAGGSGQLRMRAFLAGEIIAEACDIMKEADGCRSSTRWGSRIRGRGWSGSRSSRWARKR